MDEQTAKLVIGAGAAVGVLAWLIALQLYRRMADAPSTVALEATAQGAPAEVISKLINSAGHLAGQARLARPADNVFELTLHRCRTHIEAYRKGGQTALIAEVDDSALRCNLQRGLALFVVLLVPIAIVSIATSLWYFAAPSPAAGARWQAVQVVQMVHVLWPPFMLYGVWQKRRTTALDTASSLLVVAAS